MQNLQKLLFSIGNVKPPKEELTLLSEEDIFGTKKLDILKQRGTKTDITDLAIVTGSKYKNNLDDLYIHKSGPIWTKSPAHKKMVLILDENGEKKNARAWRGDISIRPVIKSNNLFPFLLNSSRKRMDGIYEVWYGEYPQNAPELLIQNELDYELQTGNLKKTGVKYNFFGNSNIEYEYKNKKYIYIYIPKSNLNNSVILSNGLKYNRENNVWIEVSPVKWLIDFNKELLVSEKGLISGIDMDLDGYDGIFEETCLYKFLNKYMFNDLTQEINKSKKNVVKKEKTKEKNLEPNEQLSKNEINPYGFEFDKVSEEDIIKGAIESGIAVFLHGKSSEGKSARVKEIDPDCEIIYLRNATPDSLNGKSVYNEETGEMIDIPPTWFKKLKTRCEAEPDRLHIVFFDEITNALPSIQGMAFNIILDREVNGIWHLPENARIVAAGNEMSDSLAANQMAEPLFNRFAHVYIKTTLESWLKWASTHNIHPAIYSFIAYKKGAPLRTNYDGINPNADPRKWEMASNMLYKTGNPEMLRALVGEEITKEFIQFCKQRVITLEDVIKGNYTKEDIESLNTGEKYATAFALTQVSIEDLETVRNFVKELGAEFTSIFDLIWAGNDLEKLEALSEIRLPNENNKIIQDSETNKNSNNDIESTESGVNDILKKYKNLVNTREIIKKLTEQKIKK